MQVRAEDLKCDPRVFEALDDEVAEVVDDPDEAGVELRDHLPGQGGARGNGVLVQLEDDTDAALPGEVLGGRQVLAGGGGQLAVVLIAVPGRRPAGSPTFHS